ncbi:MAG: aminoglycoside/choline kinase family phosphotransferase [Paracoccaceae bacterium]|jgi:aminoglycoside/choline kinase family phosphotransferase
MTPDRSTLIETFLSCTAWATAQRANLAGDASNRRYERLTDRQSGKTAVLMDAPGETGEDTRPFVRIATHLRAIGLSAPEIYAQDMELGFLLLEDLGDDLFARVIPQSPHMEDPLYTAATDILIALRNIPCPDLTAFDPPLMAKQASLVFDTYLAGITGTPEPEISTRFQAVFQDILHQTTQGPPVMMLRDYHAENLLWLPERHGVARVGLLDFQDAMLAHPAYDLVSLLQDARRDVPAAIEQKMIAHYITQTGVDDAAFRTAYVVLGVQRNLRIIAVFTRLAAARGKPDYIRLIPRVWAHLMRGLKHPALTPLSDMLAQTLPDPTDTNLQKLMPR